MRFNQGHLSDKTDLAESLSEEISQLKTQFKREKQVFEKTNTNLTETNRGEAWNII